MSYKYVKKCECCNDKISLISVPAIAVKHKYELICLLHDALEGLGMKGELGLACTCDVIVAFNYTYRNKKELRLSVEMCETLYEVAFDFYQKQVSEPEIHYYYI